MNNPEILRRIPSYQNQDWNPLINAALENDKRFWRYEIPTDERMVYALVLQVTDIVDLINQGKTHKIQYELADLFTMSIGYAVKYGNPLPAFEYRIMDNHKVKTEKAIVEKYEMKFQKYGRLTLETLEQILNFHKDESTFRQLEMKRVFGR